MKKSHLSLLIGSLLVAQAVYADDALKSVLETRYAEAKKAMADHDASSLSTLISSDFSSVDVTGNISDKKQLIDMIMQMPKDAKQETKTTLKSIQQTGEVAVVEQHYEMTTEKPGQGGKLAKIHMTSDSTDTWKNQGGSWLLQKTVTNVTDVEVDGKAVLHKDRPK